MKIIKLLVVILFAFHLSASAQIDKTIYRQFNPRKKRAEIVTPQVMGYNVYKGDFHTHTIYSDGDVTPALRVEEAWRDGMDIVAITDHIEYRRMEREMYHYMNNYIASEYKNEPRAINTNILHNAPDSRGLLSDFNVPSELAERAGRNLGILTIKGVEITRGKQGDYNALFTTDNNAIYDPSLEQSIRNARAQGAFIIHNHPQYDKNSKSTLPAHCEELYAKGLIDGIEVANHTQKWPRLFSYCIDGKYTPFSNTDSHTLVDWVFRPNPEEGSRGRYRNMTLVLAKRCDEKSIKEALLAQRTIAYHDNLLVSTEKILSEFFKACVEVRFVRQDGKDSYITVVNCSSFPFAMRYCDRQKCVVNALGAVNLKIPSSCKTIDFEVLNMYCGNNTHPCVSYKLKGN